LGEDKLGEAAGRCTREPRGIIGAAEEQQLRNYMTLLRIKRGLLINFQQPGKSPKKTRLEIREIGLD
jgi:hypothetical protein